MIELNIINVFAVVGDFGNFGNKSVLGIFTDKRLAADCARRCGSTKHRGNGFIEKRQAIEVSPGQFLLLDEHNHKYRLNAMTFRSRAKLSYLTEEDIANEKMIEDIKAMLSRGIRVKVWRILHDKFGWSWSYCRSLTDAGQFLFDKIYDELDKEVLPISKDTIKKTRTMPSYEKIVIRYGFETKNREVILRKFEAGELKMHDILELNKKGEFAGEDYDEIMLKMIEKITDPNSCIERLFVEPVTKKSR